MKKKIIGLLSFTAYSAVILILILNHEYWFDEAQAWNIARDNDIAGIIGMIRYEGHPPLWHFVLKIFTSLGCSWQALGLVSWGVSVTAAAVVIFALPIKPYFKAAVLLSSGMLYINSVVSRVYCLVNLLVVLLAWLYPNRKKHPLLFGILVAMLANTHICMCGLVGIIGIFMLIDYFKDFKTNTAGQNVLNSFGLLIAGAGVVLLILPLLGSFNSNDFAVEKTYTVGGIVESFITAPTEIVNFGCQSNLPAFPGLLFSIIIQISMFIWFVFLRKKRRTFTIALVFTLFYLVIVGVVWSAQPNRGALFIFSLAIICVMGREEQSASGEKENSSKSRIVEKFLKFDSQTEKSLSVLCAVMLAMTIPSGVKYAVDDLCGEFAPHKAAAEYIKENIPEDALLVSSYDLYVALMTYLPERQIYSTLYNRFYTYCSHEFITESTDKDKFCKLAQTYDSIYYICAPYDKNWNMDLVYINSNYIPFGLLYDQIAIYKADLDAVANGLQIV
ncbi:MAG: hypothetical protein HDR72_03780 [Ruminococcaceae bacterium]|nr:hypothetical protein [Oscillospiraceae bacterium]